MSVMKPKIALALNSQIKVNDVHDGVLQKMFVYFLANITLSATQIVKLLSLKDDSK